MNKNTKIIKNLGGDRLGSGSKNNIELHNYGRSTHNLSRAWRSSMNVGTLVPFLTEVGLPGDTFSINTESIIRTVPSNGPLYGSYKAQFDFFTIPIRLYNGLLHNNMNKIGLNMSAVKLPKITLTHRILSQTRSTSKYNFHQIANDSLLAYLGIRGIGDTTDPSTHNIVREFCAVPILGYWDIYKNYYANKQEERGVQIVPKVQTTQGYFETSGYITGYGKWDFQLYELNEVSCPGSFTPSQPDYQGLRNTHQLKLNEDDIYLKPVGDIDKEEIYVCLYQTSTNTYMEKKVKGVFANNIKQLKDGTMYIEHISTTYRTGDFKLQGFIFAAGISENGSVELQDFPLDNIDNMRIFIMQTTNLNNTIDLANVNVRPYETLKKVTLNGVNYNAFTQNGLAIKTYQADLLNNWLRTEYIDGPNGINTITAIDTSSGNFTIDALNLARKVYNMLNRVAVSGGSYEDYIEAVYATEAMRRAETPIYCGGMSAEIVFDEVVSQSATEDQPLGTLAGKGTATNKRGGNVEIKITEPSFIMGIVSITPRLDYSQGNKWHMTELFSMDDLHKPALDGIGFEDLLEERGAWFGTVWDHNNQVWVKKAMGKVPAWVNYMTAINETFGDFAEEDKTMFMSLNRRYEREEDSILLADKGIKDCTTYINPSKYNYVFADTTIDAQNFWVQIGMQIIARRVMSAKTMPNL